MTPVRLQNLPSLRPPSPYLAAEIAAQVRQPVGVPHSDALVAKEWVGLARCVSDETQSGQPPPCFCE